MLQAENCNIKNNYYNFKTHKSRISKMSSIFPQDVIFEILLRLPVKSVLKFRCVSKSWLFLLSTPVFSKTHVSSLLNNPKKTCYRLAVVATVFRLAKICNIYNIESENSSLTVSKLNFLPKSSLSLSWILGSCNGLICFTSTSSRLMIWNPCTGKFNVFPDSRFEHEDGWHSIRYGFGYDASFDDYKVVKIFSPFNQIEGRYENMVKVYSLKDKFWKIIQGFNSGYINATFGIFANGVLHWETCLGDSWEIVTLDLATERYGKIALPSYEDGGIMPSYEDGGISWTLGVSRGYLVGCCNYERNKADLWMMKEYGVEKFWTKLVTISSSIVRKGFIFPLFVAENGDEVLLKIEEKLMFYNSRDGSFKRLDGYTLGGFHQAQVATYFESLASPHI